MKKIVLFGTGEIAELAHFYFQHDSECEYDVVAYTADDEFVDDDSFNGCPLVPFSEVEDRYPETVVNLSDDVKQAANVTPGTITYYNRYEDELLELQDTGRVLAYDRDSGETTVELSGLGFANGVVPGPDGESLLVTETSRYRVTRYWHRGDRAGEHEQIATNLPGFPDNIDVADDGTYWVAIPNLRDSMVDFLHEQPWLARQLGKLPAAAMGALDIEPYGLVLRMTADGEVVESLHDPTGGVFGITSATSHEGALYLGSLFGERVVRYSP